MTWPLYTLSGNLSSPQRVSRCSSKSGLKSVHSAKGKQSGGATKVKKVGRANERACETKERRRSFYSAEYTTDNNCKRETRQGAFEGDPRRRGLWLAGSRKPDCIGLWTRVFEMPIGLWTGTRLVSVVCVALLLLLLCLGCCCFSCSPAVYYMFLSRRPCSSSDRCGAWQLYFVFA